MIAALICVAFAMFVIGTAMTYPGGRSGVPGPATFPILIAIILVLSSVSLMFSTRSMEECPANLLDVGAKRVYIAMILLVLFCSLIGTIGFVVTSSVFLTIFMQWFRGKNFFVNASMACATVGVVYFTFSVILKVPMDFGILI